MNGKVAIGTLSIVVDLTENSERVNHLMMGRRYWRKDSFSRVIKFLSVSRNLAGLMIHRHFINKLSINVPWIWSILVQIEMCISIKLLLATYGPWSMATLPQLTDDQFLNYLLPRIMMNCSSRIHPQSQHFLLIIISFTSIFFFCVHQRPLNNQSPDDWLPGSAWTQMLSISPIMY